MIISSYVQGFSQTVSIKKKTKNYLLYLPWVYSITCMWFQEKKNPELNRYKI